MAQIVAHPWEALDQAPPFPPDDRIIQASLSEREDEVCIITHCVMKVSVNYGFVCRWLTDGPRENSEDSFPVAWKGNDVYTYISVDSETCSRHHASSVYRQCRVVVELIQH